MCLTHVCIHVRKETFLFRGAGLLLFDGGPEHHDCCRAQRLLLIQFEGSGRFVREGTGGKGGREGRGFRRLCGIRNTSHFVPPFFL